MLDNNRGEDRCKGSSLLSKRPRALTFISEKAQVGSAFHDSLFREPGGKITPFFLRDFISRTFSCSCLYSNGDKNERQAGKRIM